MVKLYGFCLSIAYIVRRRHPYTKAYSRTKLILVSQVYSSLYIVGGVRGREKVRLEFSVNIHTVVLYEVQI